MVIAKRLANTLGLLVLLVCGTIRADHITPEEARHLLLWPERYRFLSQWQKEKQAYAGKPIPGLLAAHSEPGREGRVLSLPKETRGQYTLDHINRLWLNQALAHYYNRELDEAEHALGQLVQPLHPNVQERVIVLKAMLAQARHQPDDALSLYSQLPSHSIFQPLVIYNQALSLNALGDAQGARQQLALLNTTLASQAIVSKGQSATSTPEWNQLQGYAQLLDTRIHAEQLGKNGRIDDRAFIDGDLALYRQLLMTEASFHRARGEAEPALTALLELVDPKGDGPLSLHQSWLLQYLYQLGAGAQAANLSKVWIDSLMRQLELQHNASSQFADPDFEKRLNQRNSGDNGTSLVRFSRETRALIQDLERINSLITLIDNNLTDIRSYKALFERGRPYLVSQILQNPELAPSPPNQIPEAYRNLPPETLALEQQLNQLVGVPDDWTERYTLLDGLSRWVKGIPFPHPWWRTQVDPAAAAAELDEHLRQRRALVEELNIKATTERALVLSELEPRANTLLQRLQQNRLDLSRALARSLKDEPARMVRRTEQALLWLTAKSMPQLENLASSQPTVKYRIQRQNGERLLVKEPSGKALPDLSALHKSLRLLQEKGLNPDVAYLAQRHLADLTLMLAESAEIEGRQSPDPSVSFQRAIELYLPLLADEQQLRNPDQVLYQLARAYDLAGEPQNSLVMLERLQTNYPDNPYRQEVGFRIGEHRFNRGDYDIAAEHYQELLQQPGSQDFADRARYKLAWSEFKQGNQQAALEQFFPLVDKYWDERLGDDSGNRRLLADVLRVIAMTFAYQEGVATVDAWFNSHGSQPYAERVYADLGQYYERKNRYSDAADSFEALVKRYPVSDNAPFYQSRVVAAYSDGGFPVEAWPARERFVSRFGPTSTYWQQADEKRRDYVRTYLPDYLRLLGQRDHAKAQKAPTPAEQQQSYLLSINWYDQYLTAMPNDPRRLEIAFYKGEALTDLKRFEDASEAYELAAYGEGDFDRRADAGHAALLAYQHLYQLSSDPAIKARWLNRSIEQSRTFVSTFPNAPQAPEIATKLAEDYLLADNNEAAREVAAVLLDKNQTLEPAMRLRLWRVRAHAAFTLQLYAEAEHAYLSALQLQTEAKERATFRTRTAEAIYKQAEQARDRDKDPIAAIDHFLRLGHVISDATIRPNAEFDAATLLLAAKRWPEAIRVLEQFRSSYPKSELQATVPDKLVVAYEATQQWAKASHYLSLIYQREKDSPLGREALWRSAELQQKAGDDSKAASIYAQFVKQFPQPLEEAMDAREILVQLADKQGQTKTAESWLDAMVSALVNAKEPSDRSLLLASRAALRLGRARVEAFEKVALRLPLDKTLARKRKLMEQATGYLNQTINFGLAVPSTYATLMLGDLYRNLSQALMQSERPKDLDELALEQYEILLEEQALPFEDQSIQFYETNLGWISEGIYTPGIAKTLEQLRAIMPARYDKPEQVPAYVEAID